VCHYARHRLALHRSMLLPVVAGLAAAGQSSVTGDHGVGRGHVDATGIDPGADDVASPFTGHGYRLRAAATRRCC
jgi:hypothetical protein